MPGARKDPRYGMRAQDGGPGSPKGHHLWGGPRARSTKGPQIWDADPGWGNLVLPKVTIYGGGAACQEHERTPDMGRGPGMGRPGFPKVRLNVSSTYRSPNIRTTFGCLPGSCAELVRDAATMSPSRTKGRKVRSVPHAHRTATAPCSRKSSAARSMCHATASLSSTWSSTISPKLLDTMICYLGSARSSRSKHGAPCNSLTVSYNITPNYRLISLRSTAYARSSTGPECRWHAAGLQSPSDEVVERVERELRPARRTQGADSGEQLTDGSTTSQRGQGYRAQPRATKSIRQQRGPRRQFDTKTLSGRLVP